MKEGKQQQKYQLKVKTVSGVEKVFTTTDVMEVTFAARVITHTTLSDIIDELAEYSNSVAGTDPVVKVEQTVLPVTDNDIIQVPTSMLSGKALDYAVGEMLNWIEPFTPGSRIVLGPDGDDQLYIEPKSPEGEMELFSPSTILIQAAWLMKKYNIALEPSSREVEKPVIKATYQLGDFDKNPAVITEDSYEEAICMVLVKYKNGDLTPIPASFEKYLVG